MKDIFQEAIITLIESYIDLPYNQNTLIEEIDTLHQQAMKEAKEKGYAEGYENASNEAAEEIHRNYTPIT